MSRTVLVTGASSGIGKAVAERFRDADEDVITTGRRADRLEAVATELGVRSAVCDARDPGQV